MLYSGIKGIFFVWSWNILIIYSDGSPKFRPYRTNKQYRFNSQKVLWQNFSNTKKTHVHFATKMGNPSSTLKGRPHDAKLHTILRVMAKLHRVATIEMLHAVFAFFLHVRHCTQQLRWVSEDNPLLLMPFHPPFPFKRGGGVLVQPPSLILSMIYRLGWN